METARGALVMARNEVGLSQEQLAEAVGCSQQFVSMIEAGQRNPGLKMARKIADAVHAPVERLFPDIVETFRALLNNTSV